MNGTRSRLRLNLQATWRHPFNSRKRKQFRAKLIDQLDDPIQKISRWRTLTARRIESFQLPVVGRHTTEAISALREEQARHRAALAVLETFIQGQANVCFPVVNADLLISIVLPTFNRAHRLPQAVESVRAQSYPNWELLIIDDGSSDDTAQVVNRFLADDPRIKYVKQEHRGHSSARNHALRIAGGDVICYLDSDNTFFPAYLAAVAMAFSQDKTLHLAYGALRSDHHGDTYKIKFEPFDREKLLARNYIDLNVMAHRRDLTLREGGFDERLSRLADWDLALKYSRDRAPALLPIVAAQYNANDNDRVTICNDYGSNRFKIWQKWQPARAHRPLRILYVVWHYPQLSEAYIEAEVQSFLRMGAHIEVWRQVAPVSPYPSHVRIHDGCVEDAVASFQPDVIHVHWLGFALAQEKTLAKLDLPVTVRLHGFEVTREMLNELLKRPWVSRIYAFPHQLALTRTVDSRIRPVRSAFDTTLFAPEPAKDRRMILRTAAALESKDLQLIFELAKRLPDFRVVLAVVTCNEKEYYVQTLRELHRDMQSRVELMIDVPRDEIARLVKQAGIYVQTARRPGENSATPIGMPIGIAEAMATGCFVLAPDLPEFADYLAGTNALYRNLDDAVMQIEKTRDWTDQKWKRSWIDSVDLAFGQHADELVLFDVLEDLRKAANLAA